MNTPTAHDTPFIPAPRITTVAGYLLTRLAEAGLISVFGVPGDYDLPILDAIAARSDHTVPVIPLPVSRFTRSRMAWNPGLAVISGRTSLRKNARCSSTLAVSM